jgi:hypothetical protein
METIELDCPPGGIRPWDLIDGVVKGTIIEPMITDENRDQGAFFGHAEWVFDVPRDKWVAEVQPVIKPRIEALYHSGTIRYGSW